MSQVPKSRSDLLPHYSRLIATLNKYMPDIGSGVVAFVSNAEFLLVPTIDVQQLDEEFRYLQKKKNAVKGHAEARLKVNYTSFHPYPP